MSSDDDDDDDEVVGGRGLAPGNEEGPGTNEYVHVTGPDGEGKEGMIGETKGPDGAVSSLSSSTSPEPRSPDDETAEDETHLPLHVQPPSPLVGSDEEASRWSEGRPSLLGGVKGEELRVTEEPESTLSDHDEEELRIPGSFDLSVSANHGYRDNPGFKGWADMLRNL
jgi:hypothetical protein